MDFLESLVRAGWRPHAGQLAYLGSHARFRVLACGRRWGKTDVAAAEMARRIAESATSRQIAIAPTLTQVRIVFERARWMLAAAGIAFSSTMTPHPTLKAPDGRDVLHVLDARSGHEATNLRGAGAEHILLDEAAFMPEALVTETVMPMLAASNGRLTLISTPRGRNYFYRYFQMGQTGENDFWSRRSPSNENPLVSGQYLDLQRELLTERAYQTEYEAAFLDANSAVFGTAALDMCLIAKPALGSVVLGVDWARYRDFTAIAAVRGLRTGCEVLKTQRWGSLRWSEAVSRVAAAARAFDASLVVCDVTGVGDPVTEQLQNELRDIPVDGFHFTRASKPALIENLVWIIERARIRLTSDPELLRELENFQALPTETGISYGAAGGFHDDLVCALALACWGLSRCATAIKSAQRKGGLSL